MPLQKLPPNGPLSVSVPANQRPQLQSRRRTLQTISELSSTEGSLPDFVSSIGIENIRRLRHDNVPGVRRSTSKPAKRQSLPQHHSSSNILLPRPMITVTSGHGQGMQHAQSTKGCRPRPLTMEQVEGWNVKRERARTRQERAIIEARARRSTSDRGAEITASAAWPNEKSRPEPEGPLANEQAPLKSSDSRSSLIERVERRASSGSTNNSASRYETGYEAPERASTDSSSYQSRDSAVHRSRSGSSNTSYASQDAPPLPNGGSADIRGYCAELILQNQNLVSFGESARSKTLNPSRSSRTFSFPMDGSKHMSTPYHRYATAPDLRQLPAQHSRPISAQRARNQALAALTAVNSHSRTSHGTQHPPSTYNSAHQYRHASLTSHPSSASAHRRSASPHRNSLRYHAQLQAQRQITSPSPAYLSDVHHTSQRRKSDGSRRVSFDQRSVPKRESLTQWKKEREEARANLYTDHKAKMQERVRRANELEEERQKELVSMGKRATKAESRGCFGGLFSVLRGKSD